MTTDNSTCSVEGCTKPVFRKGWCAMHEMRHRKYGDVHFSHRRPHGSGTFSAGGYKLATRAGTNAPARLEHVLIAEKALGKRLPKGVLVHHVNEVKTDNRPENLVICTISYHTLIHQRMRAMAECGNPNWRKCYFCGQYGEDVTGNRYHLRCKAEDTRRKRAKEKQVMSASRCP